MHIDEPLANFKREIQFASHFSAIEMKFRDGCFFIQVHWVH